MKNDITTRYGISIWFYRIEEAQRKSRKNLGQEGKIEVKSV